MVKTAAILDFYVSCQHFLKFRRAPKLMFINGSYGSVMQNLVFLSAKYSFFAKLPDYEILKGFRG